MGLNDWSGVEALCLLRSLMPFRKEARLSHSLMFIPLWALLTSCLQAIVGRQVVRGSCNQVQPRPKGPVGVRGTPC